MKRRVSMFIVFLQNPKLCGFYRFQREYLDELVEKKIVRICCQQIDEHGEDEAPAVDEGMKQLENKMERLVWKMNIFIGCIAVVVLAFVVKSVAMN